MSSASADRAEQARKAAHDRWTVHEGNPVVSRSVDTVVTRAGEVSDAQWAEIEAARAALADAP